VLLTVVYVDSTSLQAGINPAQGVFIEMFVTSYLVLAVLMLAVEKHRVTPFAPVSLPRRTRPLLVTNTPFPGHSRSGSDLLSSLANCTIPDTFRSTPGLTPLFSWSIFYTGGAVNTARAFGPAVVTGFPYGTQWVVCTFPFTTPRFLTYRLSTGLARAWGRSWRRRSTRSLSSTFPN